MTRTADFRHAHYTRFGVRLQPPEADGTGYLAYREGFRALPESEWTDAEHWIAREEARIEAWQQRT